MTQVVCVCVESSHLPSITPSPSLDLVLSLAFGGTKVPDASKGQSRWFISPHLRGHQWTKGWLACPPGSQPTICCHQRKSSFSFLPLYFFNVLYNTDESVPVPVSKNYIHDGNMIIKRQSFNSSPNLNCLVNILFVQITGLHWTFVSCWVTGRAVWDLRHGQSALKCYGLLLAPCCKQV